MAPSFPRLTGRSRSARAAPPADRAPRAGGLACVTVSEPPPPVERARSFADSDLPYRVDPLSGDVTYIVAARQGRPNLPSTGCPFCPGGIEAPEHYEVFSFPNR